MESYDTKKLRTAEADTKKGGERAKLAEEMPKKDAEKKARQEEQERVAAIKRKEEMEKERVRKYNHDVLLQFIRHLTQPSLVPPNSFIEAEENPNRKSERCHSVSTLVLQLILF
ncbi:hypothetical protein PILCRDRAFT_132862 [Piloderma croceum F 1598]|uniref:Uncharacterized protein n=1 Tax=Piloderma croceum (strain F 1598) TaxID=765440 RepID=A0A0C3GLW5_PILCF|nr:hypothetical protein PILCRDRAFT_132862 [Piloderma croceum F 1598]